MQNKYFKTICIISLVLFLGFFGKSTVSGATPSRAVVLINQVRGEECCDVGTKEVWSLQVEALNRLKLPATFALRYDVLKDEEYMKIAQRAKTQGNELAVFFEITPGLAKDARVNYRGNVERWYKAQSAYLVGYEPEERKKLIDTVFIEFKKQVGDYPKSVVAWMMDTDSLTYMHDAYGVLAYEMTREQFSTDSYTLYGGVPNSPYFPSIEWLMIPAGSEQNLLPVLIVRQTVTDPLFTYGDVTSTTTSQPNDYLLGKKDFNYFEQIIASVLTESRPFGLAVIGLETSMAQTPYQLEYIKQLEYIASKKNSWGVHVLPLLEYARTFQTRNQPLMLMTRSDKDMQAFFVTTPHYRVRLIRSGAQVAITDLRVYDERFADPYNESALLVSDATWNVPYLLDGSRFFSNPRKKATSNIRLTNDFDSDPVQITLPDSDGHASITINPRGEMLVATYLGAGGKTITVTFDPTKISIHPTIDAQILIPPLAMEGGLKLGVEQEAEVTTLVPTTNPHAESQVIASLPASLLPELVTGKVSRENSIIQYVNPYAVAGSNPIRIVIRMRTAGGEIVLSKSNFEILVESLASAQIKVHAPQVSDGEYYVDISSNQAGTFIPRAQIDGQLWELSPIHFVTNCQKQIGTCLKSPGKILLYIYTKISDFFRRK